MKRNIMFLTSLLLVAGCSIDLMDENEELQDSGQGECSMTVNVAVKGTLVTTKSAASQEEMKVEDYDIFVFDQKTGSLQYFELDNTPGTGKPVAGSGDLLIDTKTIVLPSGGGKNVYLIANAGTSVSLPELSIEGEGCTTMSSFTKEALMTLPDNSSPDTPLVMTGSTFVGNAEDAVMTTTLARKVAKLRIANSLPEEIQVTKALISDVPSSLPLFTAADDAAKGEYPAVTEFQADGSAIDLYFIPDTKNGPTISIEGTSGTGAFSVSAAIPGETYSDYLYTATLSVKSGEVVTKVEPDFTGGETVEDIIITGDWITDNSSVTLPFTAEANYGITVGLELNVSGTPAVKKTGNEDWYSVETAGNQVILKAVKDNAGVSRTASFEITCGKGLKNVTVIQQGLADVGSVEFCGIEWMDRNIGAVLPANAANATQPKAWGYYYQWGRNVPFPTLGEVKVSAAQLAPAAANASADFISIDNGTMDWNAEGKEGTLDDTWDSVSGNPCPDGWRLPTYMEIQKIMPYRVTSLIFAKGKQEKTCPTPDGSSFKYLGYGSGTIKSASDYMAIHGIMNYGTDDAYYIRWNVTNEGGEVEKDAANGDVAFANGGTNVFKISYIPGADASSKYASFDAANAFWKDNTSRITAEFVIPSAGPRNSSGQIAESGSSAYMWSRSMYKGTSTPSAYASGLAYFKPAGKYMMMVAPAYAAKPTEVYTATEKYGYRAQAMPIRCVKDK